MTKKAKERAWIRNIIKNIAFHKGQCLFWFNWRHNFKTISYASSRNNFYSNRKAIKRLQHHLLRASTRYDKMYV